MSAYGPIFGEAKGLPRGPHQLTREQVSESQYTRLLIAMTESVAQRGYAAVTVAQIARHAGVSPRTFYDHFSRARKGDPLTRRELEILGGGRCPDELVSAAREAWR